MPMITTLHCGAWSTYLHSITSQNDNWRLHPPSGGSITLVRPITLWRSMAHHSTTCNSPRSIKRLTEQIHCQVSTNCSLAGESIGGLGPTHGGWDFWKKQMQLWYWVAGGLWMSFGPICLQVQPLLLVVPTKWGYLRFLKRRISLSS